MRTRDGAVRTRRLAWLGRMARTYLRACVLVRQLWLSVMATTPAMTPASSTEPVMAAVNHEGCSVCVPLRFSPVPIHSASRRNKMGNMELLRDEVGVELLRDEAGTAIISALHGGLPQLLTLDLRCTLATLLPASDAWRRGSARA